MSQVSPVRCNCNVMHAMSQPQYQSCQCNYQPVPNNGCMSHSQLTHFDCYQPHYDHASHLPHSRSMDQYTERPIGHDLFRHSLDHPIVNDSVDGHQRYLKSFVPVNHNVHLAPTPSTSTFHNNHLTHYNGGSEYALSSSSTNRPTNANYPSNKISPRNYNQQFKYENHVNLGYYPSKRTYEEDLIKFEDSPKSTSIGDRNYGYQDQSYENQYTDLLRKADNDINRQRQGYSYANALKQRQYFDNTQNLIEQKVREMDISNGEVMKSSKETRNLDRNFERTAKNRRILAEYEIDDVNSRDSRELDFESAEYMYDEENAKASRNKDGKGSMEEWNYVYRGIKKNNGNYDDGLRNGNDPVHESKQSKSVVKKIKETRSEPVVLTKSTTLTKDYKMNKSNKLRAVKIDVDEHDLYKKPHRNGKNVDTSSKSSGSSWDCEHCTYINTGTSKICSMCSKSRDFKDKPLSKSTATSV